MIDKKRNDDLIQIADKVLTSTEYLFNNKMEILESYNRQVASFGVSIAMLGPKPTVAIYYQDGNKDTIDRGPIINRKKILAVINEMLIRYRNKDYKGEYHSSEEAAQNLLKTVLETEDTDKKLQIDIIDCSIALKQVIRTYKLV